LTEGTLIGGSLDVESIRPPDEVLDAVLPVI